LVPQIFCSSSLHQFVDADVDQHVEILGFDAYALPLLDLAGEAAGDVRQSGHVGSPSNMITASPA
jgi:hypothetical protein